MKQACFTIFAGQLSKSLPMVTVGKRRTARQTQKDLIKINRKDISHD